MNEQNGQPEKKEKKSENTISPLAVVALLLLTLSESGDTALVTLLFSALMIGAVIYVAYKGISKYLNKKKEAEGLSAPPTAQEDAADGTALPGAYQTAGENAEVEPFTREKEQRLRQLDEWLANGTIDKEEYQRLKDRYEGEQ
ncbi:MAG: hypothetical protein IJ179_07080 [Oscillospiraceae bacterium]|nr:hypothetical protein [Oscillospiraceae bacterium]